MAARAVAEHRKRAGGQYAAASPWKARRARSWPGVETKSYRYSDPAVSSIPATMRRLRSSLSRSTPAPTLPARLDAEYLPTIAAAQRRRRAQRLRVGRDHGSCMNRSRNATSTTARMAQVENRVIICGRDGMLCGASPFHDDRHPCGVRIGAVTPRHLKDCRAAHSSMRSCQTVHRPVRRGLRFFVRGAMARQYTAVWDVDVIVKRGLVGDALSEKVGDSLAVGCKTRILFLADIAEPREHLSVDRLLVFKDRQ